MNRWLHLFISSWRERRVEHAEILTILRRIEKNMASQSAIDAAIAAALDPVEAAVQKVGSDMLKAFTDLNAKIAAGAPPADLTALATRGAQMASELTAFDAQAVAQQTPPTP